MKAVVALGSGKTYTDETVIGGGAIKGKNCTITKIEDVEGGKKVTFSWTLDNGTVKTDSMTVKNGEDGYTPQKDVDYFDGEKGDKGDTGNGITTITKTSTAGIVDTYTILFDDGDTTTFNVINGANITKVSELENDEDFVKATTLGLVNYYLKDETYSKSQVDEILRNVGAGLSVKIVSTLPLTDISPTTIYLINTSGSNYNQYMNIDGEWANLGSTAVDMSSYYNKTQIDNKLEDYVTSNRLTNKLDDYVLKTGVSKVGKSNSYNDLDDLPEIPDVSGLKPYVETLQDSVNTAPVSKVVYDAVQELQDAIKGAGKIDDDAVETDSTWSSKKINDSLVDIEQEAGNVYSTEETVCGKWIDGKKIYRKVLLCATEAQLNAAGSWTDVSGWSETPSDIKEFVRIDTSNVSLGNRIDYSIQANKTLKFYSLVSYLYVKVGDKLVLEYTKTTD